MDKKTALAWMTIIAVLIASSDATDEEIYKPKTNLGYTMKLRNEVQLYNGYVRLIYHFHLPDFTFHGDEAMTEEIDAMRRLNYFTGQTSRRYVANIAIKLHKMKRDIVMTLQSRKSEIKESLFEINATARRRRGLGSWRGSGIAHVFGLATTENLDDIKHLLTEVLAGTKKATSAWRKGQNLTTKITSLTGKRLDHFAKLMHFTRQTLRDENLRLQTLDREAQATNKIIGVIVEEIHMAILNLYEIDSIYITLHELSKGRLSHHLVNSTSLAAGINDISENLEQTSPEFELIYKTLNYYYAQAKVGGAIHKESSSHVLLKIIEASIVLKSDISPPKVWELTYFPLRSPDNQEFYSILYNALKFIAYSENNPFYFTAATVNELPFDMSNCLETMQFVRMSNSDVHLRRKNKLSCSTALMTGSMVNIKALCELHLLYRFLQPAVYVIADGKLLISNITKVHIKRKGRIVQNSSTHMNHMRDVRSIDKILENFSPQYIINLPCESQAIVNDIVYLTERHCNPEIAETDINTSFPLNIMVLKHYFSNHSLLSDLNSALELNQSLFAELPPLLVQGDQYDKILAKKEETRFDFNAALNSSIQQEKIYSDLSTVLYEKMITIGSSIRSFNPFRPETWCLALSMAVTVVNSCIIIWLVMRIKALYLMAATVHPTRADLIFTYPPTTIRPKREFEAGKIWQSIQNALTEIWGVETLLILILLILGIILILLIKKTALKKPKHQAYVRLDLPNANYCLQKVTCKLQYSLKYYKIDIYYDGFRVEKIFTFGMIKLPDSIKISQKVTELRIPVRGTVYLLPYQVQHMINLLANDHVANLSIFDYKHRLIDVIRLTDGLRAGKMRDHNISTLTSSETSASTAKLYPDLQH